MNRITIFPERKKGTINRNIYGHFAEHIGGVFYDGLWVGEETNAEHVRGFRKSIIDDLKRINAPVIRWPGGCFAEAYDWRDGIGPQDQRPIRANWWHADDNRTESNQVGTHEFMDFCDMVGAEAYFAANATSLSGLQIRDWVEYCTYPGDTTLTRERRNNGAQAPFNIPYWGIGNENWGGGGNMVVEHYADHYRKFGQLARNAFPMGKFIACGPCGNDLAWTEGFFRRMTGSEVPIYGLSAHYYCGTAGTAQEFTDGQWYQLLARAQYMDTLLREQWELMGKFDKEHKIGIVMDEWGCWHPGGSGTSKGHNLFEQQSTMRDAVVAALTLNIFNNHCDKVIMANVAQTVNNLHSLFLASGEHCVRTPNYYVFDMFKQHQGAECLQTGIRCESLTSEADEVNALPLLSASASRKGDKITLTVANLDPQDEVEIILSVEGSGIRLTGQTLLYHGDLHAVNDFEVERIRPETKVMDCAVASGCTKLVVPKGGVAMYRIKG